jgi:acetyl-CoA carboxylase carboxyl transferase subunit alpha
VPFVATIIGEGGSGGAIALAAADRVLMLEHAIYSVISPEGCASILWRDAAQAAQAAEALSLTATTCAASRWWMPWCPSRSAARIATWRR